MKQIRMAFAGLAFLTMIGSTVYADDEPNTEITGYYQQYRNFSFNTGISVYDFPSTAMKGGGFTLARNLAPWFAVWTQFSFYGSIHQPAGVGLRVIHNLEGVRWQTKQHGPLRLYVKGGMGFAHYGFDFAGNGLGDTKFSFAYGGGAQLWATRHFGAVFDLSHTIMSLPNLTDLDAREKWDSGLSITTGMAIRF